MGSQQTSLTYPPTSLLNLMSALTSEGWDAYPETVLRYIVAAEVLPAHALVDQTSVAGVAAACRSLRIPACF